MASLVSIAWLLLALIHLAPAATALSPTLLARLYGSTPTGDLAVLLAHRGALFAAVFASCVLAALDPASRRAAALVASISVLGFLALYLRAGAPAGPLRTIALVDALGLAPLAVALLAAWRGPSGAPL